MGRDADTIAALAGEIMGVIHGSRTFPPAWVEQVLRLNPSPDLSQMARDLCALISRRALVMQHTARQIVSMTE